jgi:hypothetical protein
MDTVIMGSVIAFLLLIVLAMQFQLNALSNKMEENISRKLDELLQKKGKESIGK